jgi:hypothetical protein
MLSDAFNRWRDEDMRTPEVFAALDMLGKMVNVDWPFRQFRKALDNDNEEGRWQLLNVSFNAINLAVLNNNKQALSAFPWCN